jgi:hypothetical protein
MSARRAFLGALIAEAVAVLIITSIGCYWWVPIAGPN